jgi:predicted nucleic acid-binding protein
MNYVLDASVALKWVLPEPLSNLAQALRDDFRKTAHVLLAPDVFVAEVGHGLARAERRGIIQSPQGSILLADILSTPPQMFPAYPSLITRAFAIASQWRVGVYDCLYVALAEREQCDLITADDKLVKNLQPQFSFILPLSSLMPPPASAP